LIELHATLNEPGPHRRIPHFARIGQEVTKRFYNLSAVHCLRRGIARYSLSTEKFACHL
jgi:hypothetical protein